jgi:hypothetical protein
MPKTLSAPEKIERARQLIQAARDLPVPENWRLDLTYIAQVKDLLRQAKDLVKFISITAGVSAAMKVEVKQVYEEIEQANREILR